MFECVARDKYDSSTRAVFSERHALTLMLQHLARWDLYDHEKSVIEDWKLIALKADMIFESLKYEYAQYAISW